ncbi:glycosyltransferase, partial [Limnoraphis robusta]
MSSTIPPKVSAIVSTYNAERFIKGLLDDLLQQTIVRQLEIIVIDSGSTQNEGAIVKEYQAKHSNIKYLRTERETVYKAWNRGIEMATGEYITNANTDDRHRADAYEVMAKELDKSPDIALVYSNVAITIMPNETFECNSATGLYLFDEHDRNLLLSGFCYIGPMPMWRKSIHEKVGLFDPNYKTSGDFEFWIRASEVFNFKKINQILGLYQHRSDSIEQSSNEEKRVENQALLFKHDLS